MKARSKPHAWWNTPAIKRKREKPYKHGKDVWESREGQGVSSGKSKPAPLTTLEKP